MYMEKYKYNPKIKTQILMIVLIMLMLPILFITSPAKRVYAAGNGGQQNGGDGSTSNKSGGVSASRTGFVFYITEKGDTRESLSKVHSGSIFVSPNDFPDLDEGHLLYATKAGAYSGSTAYPARQYKFSDAPTPVIYRGGFKTNGDAVKRWLEKSVNGVPMYLCMIKDTYGESVYNLILENADDWCVAVEPVAWHNEWVNGQSSGEMYFATATTWMSIHNHYGVPETGDPQVKKFTHKFLPGSMVLQYPLWGFNAYANTTLRALTYNEIRNDGYGIQEFDINSSQIRTYWEPNGSPGNPEPNDPPKNGFCNIVKGYYEENETTGLRTGLGVYWEKDVTNKIVICDEPEFQLVRWDIGSTFNKDLDPTNWNPPLSIRNGMTPQSVTLKNPEKTVYVLLKKVINEAPDLGEVNYNLSQSTITRRVDFSEPDSQTGMAEIHTKEFTWSIDAHITTCNHTWTTNDSCPGNHQRTHSHSTGCPEGCNEQESYNCGQNCVTTNHSASCEWGTWEDSGLRFTLKNTKAEEEGYTKILGTQESKYRQRIIEKGEITGVRRYADRTRSTTDATEYPINNWDYRCVLWRGKDQLIVAEWKNDDLGTSEANTDLETISSVDNSGFRIADNGAAQREKKDYKEEFSAEINDDSPDKRTTYRATTGALVNGNRVTPCPTDKNRDASLKEGLDIDVKVKYDVYSGSTNGGYNDTYCSSGVQSHNVPGYNKHNGIEVPSGGEISFKPYIKMNYSTYDNKDPLTAYVLGEHTRSITPNDYAEICWNEQSEPNLRLTSLQWSTHKAAADKWGAGNVLPGGAALSLSIPPESRQEMILTTYQIILEGSGKAQTEKTGGDIGNFTRDKATEAHQAYVNSVVQGIESLNVEQWVNTATSNPAWSGNGHAVNFGKDISFIGTSGLKASDDMKYYFNDDGTDTPASEGDLDVKAGSTRTETYTFFTNTDGEVRYIKDNVNPNVGSETMGETASGGMADFLNERTHIVDKLEKAVERNTGNDAAYGDEGIRSGKQRWYNEAFDGVTVIMQQTKILAGYVNPPERTTVLDPRLCKPNKAGQSGMFAEGSYSSSQYKCKEYTQAYGEKNQVGLFKNQAVYTDSLDKLFKSKVFYIANMNTEDLH